MKKRMICVALALVMMVSLLPISAVAAEAKDTDLQSIIAAQYDAYVAANYKPNVHNEAVSQMLYHSLDHPGQILAMDESDPMTACLLQTGMYRLHAIQTITKGIEQMHAESSNQILVGSANLGWHDYALKYKIIRYAYNDTHDWEDDVSIQYLMDNVIYDGPVNQNDKAMILVVGGATSRMRLKVIESNYENITYSVDVTVYDNFSFNSDYSSDAAEGYDVSVSLLISAAGKLMLNPYDWYTEVSFNVTIPNTCTHSPQRFRWERDGVDFRSSLDEAWDENKLTRMSRGNEGAEKERYYYKLDNGLILYHDRPWVVEFRMDGNSQFILAERDWYSYHESKSIVKDMERVAGAVAFNYEEDLPKGETVLHKGRKQYGVNYIKQGVDPTVAHTYRLENRLTDGGNYMVYLFVDDTNLGPLQEYSVYYDKDRTVVEDGNVDEHLSELDFRINYVFNQSIFADKKLPVEYLEVYPMGVDADSCMETYEVEARCIEPALRVQRCVLCGAEEKTEIAPALGHSYGEYAYNNDAKCTVDGTQTRKCTACGVADTTTAPNTATGHNHTFAVTPPTYTEQGYTTYTCHCGDTYKDNYVEVRKHSYESVITAPTCIEQGYTTYYCTECDDSYVADYTEIIEHTPVIDLAVAPTCVSKGLTEGSHCGVCGQVLTKQAAISVVNTHRMEESIVKLPTYDEVGQIAYICKDCGKTDYKEIPLLNKPEPVNPFTDVLESDWFYQPVMWAVANGVTGGKTPTTFAPNEGCTRAHVVTFLWAANGKPEPVSMSNPFEDVPDDAWYAKPVLWAVENGITGGTSATTFGPEQTCTRAQIVTFLYAAAEKPEVSGGSTFKDVADADWFAKPVIWAAQNDVTGGIGDGKFGPNNTCTRGQVVTFLYKVYGDK